MKIIQIFDDNLLCKYSKMSYKKRYHEWARELAASVYDKNEKKRRRNNVIIAVCINECENVKKNI